MLRCYEPAHIAGVSKSAYAPATPRCLDWRRDLSRPRDPDPQSSASPACSPSSRSPSPRPSRRSPAHREPVVVHVRAVAPPPIRESHAHAAPRPRWARPTVPSPTARPSSTTSPGRRQARPACSGALRRAATRRRRRRRFAVNSGWRSPRLPAAAARRGGREVRLARRKPPAGSPRPTRPRTCPATRSTSGPPMPRLAVRARRRVRAVPDLRQRAVALRAAPRGRRRRLPAHVRRPHPRSEDAAVNTTA